MARRPSISAPDTIKSEGLGGVTVLLLAAGLLATPIIGWTVFLTSCIGILIAADFLQTKAQ